MLILKGSFDKQVRYILSQLEVSIFLSNLIFFFDLTTSDFRLIEIRKKFYFQIILSYFKLERLMIFKNIS